MKTDGALGSYYLESSRQICWCDMQLKAAKREKDLAVV